MQGGEICESTDVLPGEFLFVSDGTESLEERTCNQPTDWVALNVGGVIFNTTRDTLIHDKDSMLARMFGSWWDSQRDSSGAYLLDRSPSYFGPLLHFLRTDQLLIPESLNPRRRSFGTCG